MTQRREIWGGKQARAAHYDARIQRDKIANFGYQKVPEDDKTRQVVNHFNSVARQYDFMNTLLSFGIHYIWKRMAVNKLDLKTGDRVLDVCGGTGDLAILARRAVGATGRVTIFDINRAMMDAGRYKRSNAAVRKRIAHIQGNAEQISCPDESFDAVMVGFGIRNVTRMEQGFREMYRVLKPGGKMMCLEFSKPTNTVFRWLYDNYSFYLMPLLGQALAGSKKAYTHLPESIRMFPLPDELTWLLENIGFSKVTYCRLTNGIAVIHIGHKN